MFKNVFTVALVAAVVSANNGKSKQAQEKVKDDPDFKTWVAKNNKNYKNQAEMMASQARFEAQAVKIKELRVKNPKTRYALNAFSDKTEDEMKAMMGLDTSRLDEYESDKKKKNAKGRKMQAAQPSINWIERGHTTSVKYQGQCGSCWTFGATTVLEAKESIKDTAEKSSFVAPIRLSEQQGVDCSGSQYINYGCDGGWPSRFWDYLIDVGGSVNYADYTYSGNPDEECKVTSTTTFETKVSRWSDVAANDQAIAEALQSGPLSLSLMVEGDFSSYAGGMWPVDECVTDSVNHAVALVGYENGIGGTEPGPDVYVDPVEPVYVDPVTRWVEGTPSVWVEPVLEWQDGREAEVVPESQVWVDPVPGAWVEPEQIWVPGTESVYVPGEQILVEGEDPVFIEGTEDIVIPATAASCYRRANRWERRSRTCDGGVDIYYSRYCCTPGAPEQVIPGEPGYYTEGTEDYYTEGPGTWTEATEGYYEESVPGYFEEDTPGYFETVPAYTIPATEGEYVEVEPGYYTEAIEGYEEIVTPGYYTEEIPGYWTAGPDVTVQESEPYWIVQNSWGTWWGDNGLFMMPVVTGDSDGHCNSQRFIENVEVEVVEDA